MPVVYNVRDFGARADGITNDRAAIQAAIDAAHNAGGGTVYLPAGTYGISGVTKASYGGINVLSNVTLAGDGMGMTVIRAADGANEDINGLVRTPVGEVTVNVTLRDFTIDGNRANNPDGKIIGLFTGVSPGSPLQDANILIERVEAVNHSSYGFDPHEQTLNLTIRDSLAHGNGLDGFVADYLIASSFSHNFAWDNARHGFNVVTTTHDFTLPDNYAFGNGATGLTVQRGSDDVPLPYDVTIEGGAYYGNGEEGVRLQMSDLTQIRDTDIFGNGRYGIRMKGADRSTVEDSIIRNNSQLGSNLYDEIEIREHSDDIGVHAASDNAIRDSVLYASGASRSKWSLEEVLGAVSGTTLNNTLMHGSLKGGASLGATALLLPFTAPSGGGTAAIGAALADKMTGGSFGDILIGCAGNDTLLGSGGDDWLLGGDDHDILGGGNGHDRLYGDDGDDELNGNGGDDRLFGDSGNDILLGTAGHDTLLGGAGNDTLDGGSDHDELLGDAGDDALLGGKGNDILFDATGNNTLSGGKGNDVLYGGDGADTLDGNSENDYLMGFGGNDLLLGGSGGDTIAAGDGDDTVAAGSDSDLVNGGAGNDSICGDNGHDRLLGDAGNDYLQGNTGQDTLIGGAGDDTLYGGISGIAETDVFLFAGASGHDVIREFNPAEDLLHLYSSTYADFGALTAVITALGANTLISLDTDTSILLESVDALSISAANFLFN